MHKYLIVLFLLNINISFAENLNLSLPLSDSFNTSYDNNHSDIIKSISLDDVREKALLNNLHIKIANYDPQISNQDLIKENAKFNNSIFIYSKKSVKDFPSSNGNLYSIKSSNSIIDKSNVKLNNLESYKDDVSIESGINIPLRTGGNLSISYPLQYSNSKGIFDSTQYNSALKFSASIPLLRNSGKDVNEFSIKIAEIDNQSSLLKAKLQSIRILTSIDKAYWDLYEAWANLDIRQNQYKLSMDNLKMVEQRVNSGLSAPIELNRAKSGVAERIDSLLSAKTNLSLAQRQLDFFLNNINQKNSIYNTSTQPSLTNFNFNIDELIAQGSSKRLEILEQELKLSADLLKINYLENQKLPLFSLDYQYGSLSSYSDNFNSINSNIFSNYNDWSIAFKFEMPINNDARKAAYDSAIIQRLQRLSSKELQELSIKKEILDAVDKINLNWNKINIAKDQVIIASINYQSELKQFNEGIRTMTEVIESLSKLGDAQQKEIKAIKDYQVSIIDLSFATGTVLDFTQIKF